VKSVRVRAFAKINLSLRVLGTRADGFHELRTIFQSVALHDVLTISSVRGPFRLECDDPACPTDSTNLVARAAAAVWKAAGRRGAPQDIAIRLKKRIPMAAGLGGGSSDGAAALRALAHMWRVDRAKLPAIAATLGADVPYFLEGGTVLGLERGDLLFPLVDSPSAWVTLVIPAFGVSTKEAFGWFDRDHRAARSRADSTVPAGSAFPRLLVNDLEAAVARRHPDVARIVSSLRAAGAAHAAMTGSGSTVFGLFAGKRTAEQAAAFVSRRSRRVLVTRTIARDTYRRLAAK
jgi:4-diphosphocytidyl-2-C-methyl-D-erythritol kinase